LRASIACRSTSLFAEAVDAGTGEGRVRACRNVSVVRGGVGISEGDAGAIVSCNILRRGNDTEGAEH
jgi:hypothetical protein